MIIPRWLIPIFEGEYFVLTFGFVLFTVSYAVLTWGAWRRSIAGRLLMALGSSCSVILILSVLRIFLPEAPWRIYASALALGALTLVVIWLNWLLYARQLGWRAGTRKDHVEREDEQV